MTREELRRIVEANDEAWEGWWPTLSGLSDEQARRSLVGSFPCILATTAHMVWSEASWQECLEQKPEYTLAPHPGPMAAVEAQWRALRERRGAWLTNADPDGEARFTGDDGSVFTIRAWECVIHMISHAHFHRGQLATQMRQVGLVPPSCHLIGRFMQD